MMLYNFDDLPKFKGGHTFLILPGERERKVYRIGEIRRAWRNKVWWCKWFGQVRAPELDEIDLYCEDSKVITLKRDEYEECL